MRSLNLVKAVVLPTTMLMLVSACGSKAAKSTSPTTTLPSKTVSSPSSTASTSTSPSTTTTTTPSYGATVSSPMRVGGRITGVDESVRVRIYQWSSSPGKAIGEHCCLPAGGQSTPWMTTVSYSGATDSVLVITASTGGHLQGIEKMAFTAVRRRS